MIYICENILDFDIEQALRAVSSERRDKAMRYRFDIDRRQSIAAYLLLKHGIKQEYGLDIAPMFSYEAKDKPFIADYRDIHFNISHCRKAVACAISRHPIGVDIEEIAPIDRATAERIMSTSQLDDIRSSIDPELTFCKLWTTKESILKQTGEGLSDDLQHLAIDKYTFTHLYTKEYVCTACYSHPDQHEDFCLVTL